MTYLIRLRSVEDCDCKAVVKAENEAEARRLAAEKLGLQPEELIAIESPFTKKGNQ